MRDLRVRLAELGLSTLGDLTDTYDDVTVAIVQDFQRARGLPITGEADETTWTRLVEAGWHLGQRLLFLARPHQRGDDVADLQVRLAQLGFNPGRIDGIFGPLLEHALIDFQRNCALPDTGVLSLATLFELQRLSSVATSRSLVNEARDVAGFNDANLGPVIVTGQSALAQLVAASLEGSFNVRLLENDSPDRVAETANSLRATVVLSFEPFETRNSVHLHYWASYRSHSRQGEQLASAFAGEFSACEGLPRVEVTGMALPILRETRMTTLQIEHGPTTQFELEALAEAMSRVLKVFFHRLA